MNEKIVLICDDSITARKKLRDCIISKGDFQVIEAPDGASAVSLYKEYKPDLVIMDIVMPKKDGTQATKEIIEFDEKAKIVILSSAGTKENLKKAITYGAADFIQKPWDDARISLIIQKLVTKGV